MATHDELGDTLYRIPEAMRILKVARSTIYRMIDRGELEVRHFGGCARITRRSLEAVLRGEDDSATLQYVNTLDRR